MTLPNPRRIVSRPDTGTLTHVVKSTITGSLLHIGTLQECDEYAAKLNTDYQTTHYVVEAYDERKSWFKK